MSRKPQMIKIESIGLLLAGGGGMAKGQYPNHTTI